MEDLAKLVWQTIVFFDCLDFPLTKLELFKWFKIDGHSEFKLESLSQLEEILTKLEDKVETQAGLVFLKGRSELVNRRLAAYNFSEEKFRSARKYFKLLSLIPFVKTILITNRLAYGNVHQQSDVDLAVIVQKNRLWLGRLLTVGLLDLLKVRPKQIERQKTIDLNFFISEADLNLKNLIFDEAFVFPYWLSQLVAIYDQGQFAELVKANHWLKDYLPNYYPYQLAERRIIQDSWWSKTCRGFLKLIFDWPICERWAEKYQRRRLPKELNEMMNKDSRVIINQQMLKFHQSESWRQLKITLAKLYENY